MALVTFLSDFGEEDHYVAAVKATILSEEPGTQIVDLSHHITPFDIAHAAYVLSSTFRRFPEKTVHLVAIDPSDKIGGKILIAEIEGHFFVGKDTGIFSLISTREPSQMIEVEATPSTFLARDQLAPLCAQLANGTLPDALGKPAPEVKRLVSRQPRITRREIIGNVIRVDAYGNLISNIEKAQFDKVQELNGHVPFAVAFGRERSNVIHDHYHDADPGECYVLFNSSEKLQIGINKGNASQLLGLRLDAPIFIEFKI